MKPPFLLGLTGSIGMGKSTTSAMFSDLGIPVWDADAAVHRLYGPGGAAVPLIADQFPGVVINGTVSRDALKARISADQTTLTVLESIVHPLVAADRAAFLADSAGDLILLDIPLLFEKGTDTTLDATLLVTAPADLQRSRVLARSGMTPDLFQQILARQMPDAEKRSRATHVTETLDLSATRSYVSALVNYIRGRNA